MIRPQELPKLRDQTLRHLHDPASAIRAGPGADVQPGLDGLAFHLSIAELYFVTGDMAALAVSAGAQLAAASWGLDDRPAPCGLIMFGGGIGQIDAHGMTIPIDGCAWGTLDGECLIWLVVTRRRIATAIAASGTGDSLDIAWLPPLLPVYGCTLPLPAPVPMADVGTGQTVVATMAAAWLLMQQPTLTGRVREHADKDVRRAYARTGRPDPQITMVDLRRQYVPSVADEPGQADGRYRHRWVVSGHWRQQPHGPGRTLRRQQWIPAYVKGPDGAPLLATERVNVWRR